MFPNCNLLSNVISLGWLTSFFWSCVFVAEPNASASTNIEQSPRTLGCVGRIFASPSFCHEWSSTELSRKRRAEGKNEASRDGRVQVTEESWQ